MIWRTIDVQYKVEWDDPKGHAIRFFDSSERQKAIDLAQEKKDDATAYNVYLRRTLIEEAEL